MEPIYVTYIYTNFLIPYALILPLQQVCTLSRNSFMNSDLDRDKDNKEIEQLKDQVIALEQLLEVYEQETTKKSEELELALLKLQQTAQLMVE